MPVLCPWEPSGKTLGVWELVFRARYIMEELVLECGSYVAMRWEEPHLIAVPLRCKMWECEACGPRRKRKLVAEVLSGSPLTFITLPTRFIANADPDQQAVNMSHAFQTLVKRLRRRKQTPEFEYVAIFEQTKKGWPHLHILTRTPYIPKHWLSKNWNELTGSYIVDVRKITDPTIAARYVAKYVGKAPHHFQGTKRYRFSMKYRPPSPGDQATEPQEKLDWQILPVNLLAVKEAWSTLKHELHTETPTLLSAQPANYVQLNPFNGIQMNSPTISYLYARETLETVRGQELPLSNGRENPSGLKSGSPDERPRRPTGDTPGLRAALEREYLPFEPEELPSR